MTTIILIHDFLDGHFLKVKSDDPTLFRLVIDTLKIFIPATFRSYNPAQKEWKVSDDAGESFQRWLAYCCQTLHAEVKWVDADEAGQSKKTRTPPPPPPPRRNPTSADAFKALHLLPSAPPEVVRAVYKTLAKLNHPDIGGDTETMARVNSAFELLSKQMAA